MARAVFIVVVVGLALAVGATVIQRTHAAGAERPPQVPAPQAARLRPLRAAGR